MTDNYTEFYLNSNSNVVALECFEIKHSKFTTTYRIVTNDSQGITVKHEDSQYYAYSYVNSRITLSSCQNDLDYSIKIDFMDLGEIIPREMDQLESMDGFSEKPQLIHRCYRSDNLNTPIFGPVILEIKEFAFNKSGCSFEAKAPTANAHSTGMAYNLDDYPMLRGLL